jgi:hypothetical protein
MARKIYKPEQIVNTFTRNAFCAWAGRSLLVCADEIAYRTGPSGGSSKELKSRR